MRYVTKVAMVYDELQLDLYTIFEEIKLSI